MNTGDLRVSGNKDGCVRRASSFSGFFTSGSTLVARAKTVRAVNLHDRHVTRIFTGENWSGREDLNLRPPGPEAVPVV
jgi:hypothetical protein